MIIKTVTGWIVNQHALDSYNESYLAVGNQASAMRLLEEQAQREDWARGKVAAAGKSWDTHLAKFDGTVLPRCR